MRHPTTGEILMPNFGSSFYPRGPGCSLRSAVGRQAPTDRRAGPADLIAGCRYAGHAATIASHNRPPLLATADASGRPLSPAKCSTAIRWSSRSRRRRRRALRHVDPRPRHDSRVTPSPASNQRRSPSATRAVEGSPASMVIARAKPPASSSSMLGSLQRARGAGASASGSLMTREHVGTPGGPVL
jgi:hypothetical protein